MNVAAPLLCKELYKLSHWGEFGSTGDDLPSLWYEFGINIKSRSDIGSGTIYLNSHPAYDLGYLLRKLPMSWVKHAVVEGGEHFYLAEYLLGNDPQHSLGSGGNTPEDAAAKLCIELIKENILQSSVTDREEL